MFHYNHYVKSFDTTKFEKIGKMYNYRQTFSNSSLLDNHKRYQSGLHFLMDQSLLDKDWANYLRFMSTACDESLEEICRKWCINVSLGQNRLKNDPLMLITQNSAPIDWFRMGNSVGQIDNSQEQMWQLWRWKPPAYHELQSRDDYFHNASSTPLSIMDEFKKHLHAAKDLRFPTKDLRRLAAIEYQPLMSFVAQDFYDKLTDLRVRSYFIFKDGVMPLWEDVYNVFGGCWSLIWDPQAQCKDRECLGDVKKTSKYVWKQVIALLTDPLMVNYINELCGVGLTIRSNKTYKITVWNRNSDDTITKMMIGQIIQSILGHSGQMFYYSHRTTLNNQVKKKTRRFSQSKMNQSIHANNNNAPRKSFNQWKQSYNLQSRNVPTARIQRNGGGFRSFYQNRRNQFANMNSQIVY